MSDLRKEIAHTLASLTQERAMAADALDNCDCAADAVDNLDSDEACAEHDRCSDAAPLFWFNLPDRRTSPVLAGAMARAVATACTTLGLVCGDVSAGRRHGVECSVWTVTLPAQKGGA